MTLFLLGIALLIIGYFTYGKFVERVIGPDDRDTPAVAFYDGVDFVKLPHWKNMLIQLLNIAGVGPVIGVILGIKFGAVVFLIIPLGNVLGGAVHDYLSGMMSLRNRGANLPALVRMNMGDGYYRFFSWFMVFLLLLVVAVFINIPANLIDGMAKGADIFWLSVIIVFAYYIIATLFPIDKIIGRIYPFFGAMLLLGTFVIFVAVVWNAVKDPSLLMESAAFKAGMFDLPIIPVLFVTISCGIMSGFHATQSPIIARTMETERQGRPAFYGMMIAEGVIAMIWAAAGMAIYNLFPELMNANPSVALGKITEYFLGSWVGGLTIAAVIILAVTSGDTAMRSMRLSLAEMFGISQKSIKNRLLICVPLIVIIAGLLWWSNRDAKSFNALWNYFAWGNQVLAASTLLAAAAWLVSLKKNWAIAMFPAIFMSFIVISFILWTSPDHGGPVGAGLHLHVSYAAAAVATLILAIWSYRQGLKRRLSPPSK